MTLLRRLLLDHRALSAWVIALALLMKLVVPAGFMPVVSGDGITIEMCSGAGPQKMAVAMPGMAHHQDQPHHQGKEMPCGFAGLSAPSLAAADPLLLALASAFILVAVFRAAAAERMPAPAFLRPPSRGPPATS